MRLRWWVLAPAFVLLTSCAVRHPPAVNWRLDPGTHVLAPPKQAPNVRQVELPKVRAAAQGSNCDVSTKQLQLTWRKRSAVLTLSPELAYAGREVTVIRGAATSAGNVVADVSWWPDFEQQLAEKANAGCMTAVEARDLMRRILENVPMQSGIAWQLRYGSFDTTGYLDLQPGLELKWVLPHGGGFETVRYDVIEGRRGGVRIAFRAAEQEIQGAVTPARRASAELTIPGAVPHIRYFFRTWTTRKDRKIALIGVSDRTQLRAATEKFEADPDAFCSSSKEVACVTIPANSILTPETRITINGKPAAAPALGTLGDALGMAKIKARADQITVSRPWSGQLVPVEFQGESIFRLVLIGGEDVRVQ